MIIIIKRAPVLENREPALLNSQLKTPTEMLSITEYQHCKRKIMLQ